MSKNEDLSRFVDNEIGYLVLITGTNDVGEDMWFYASIPPSKYEAFKEAEAAGAYDIADYGEVLRAGPGSAPDAQTVEEMKREYGADANFEDRYNKIVKNISTIHPR